MSSSVSRVDRAEPLRVVLRDVLRAAVDSSGGMNALGSVECRAMLALYWLLGDHRVDRWGRCRSCRRPGSVVGSRWCSCQVYDRATWCLQRFDEVLLLSVLNKD